MTPAPWAVLADPTRRRIVDLLIDSGAASATTLYAEERRSEP
ncbi:hypothetical protein [Nocardioides sp. TF02-7]|nr:hypothetical protein [Nocardioides sp. TF02-7]